jgi:hypothetical protein
MNGDGVKLTNLVLVDANGNVVGPVSNLGNQIAHVIVFPDHHRKELEVRSDWNSKLAVCPSRVLGV